MRYYAEEQEAVGHSVDHDYTLLPNEERMKMRINNCGCGTPTIHRITTCHFHFHLPVAIII